MSLESLNLAERQILSRVEQVTGLMEEKNKKLRQGGVYREYGEIYEAYVDLAESENEGLEALKRATFLMWHEQAEPACFTGLSGLSEEANRKVLEALERRIEAGGLDFELKWMVPWYYFIAEWAFSEFDSFVALRSFLQSADSNAWEQIRPSSGQFDDRGQMGEYWKSVIGALKTRRKLT